MTAYRLVGLDSWRSEKRITKNVEGYSTLYMPASQ